MDCDVDMCGLWRCNAAPGCTPFTKHGESNGENFHGFVKQIHSMECCSKPFIVKRVRGAKYRTA